MSPAVEWLGAFALTQAIEMPIYARVVPAPHRWLKAFGASALTHPIVWWMFPRVLPWEWWAMALAELFAFSVEAAYLVRLRARRPLLWSLVANAASCGAGLGVYALLDRL
jgi:hypothetical protein